MKITETKIKVSDLVENYLDDGDGGVYSYDNRLTIRPSFQREFIYREEQQTISIAQYVNKDFPVKINGNDKFF